MIIFTWLNSQKKFVFISLFQQNVFFIKCKTHILKLQHIKISILFFNFFSKILVRHLSSKKNIFFKKILSAERTEQDHDSLWLFVVVHCIQVQLFIF